MRIQEVIKNTGISKKALQVYEDSGLIQVYKDESGYRVYDEACVRTLWKIKVLRKMDFSVAEITSILQDEDRISIFQKHFNEIDMRMTQCAIQKDYMQQLYEEIEKSDDPQILQEFDAQMQEDFQHNESIISNIEYKKGKGLTYFLILLWALFDFFLIFSNSREKSFLGIALLFPTLYWTYTSLTRKLFIQPKSSFDILIDDGVQKVKYLMHFGRK